MYVDGADEITKHLAMIKGGGGALTREKIVGRGRQKFVCIADESKLVDVLGKFPLPVEVIPMARSHVARQLVKLGGQPVCAAGVHDRQRQRDPRRARAHDPDPVALEGEINQIAGVVVNGLFARRRADVLLLGDRRGRRRPCSSTRPYRRQPATCTVHDRLDTLPHFCTRRGTMPTTETTLPSSSTPNSRRSARGCCRWAGWSSSRSGSALEALEDRRHEPRAARWSSDDHRVNALEVRSTRSAAPSSPAASPRPATCA